MSLAVLQHDGHTVKLDTHDGMIYIVRPYVEGKHTSYIGPFDLKEHELALEIAACHFAHGQAS